MRRDDMFGQRDFDTAEELLAALDPSRGFLWQANRDSLFTDRAWVFRGVWDVGLPLDPAAFRTGAFDILQRTPEGRPPIKDAKEQRDLEDHALVEFCSEADRLGFHVPTDRPELRDPRHAVFEYDRHRFPPVEKLHMYALAQHYGVPTRLLDWTRETTRGGVLRCREVHALRR